jgi:O-acetyl-ADP-ribose deacetylase (regulator of RNase III)
MNYQNIKINIIQGDLRYTISDVIVNIANNKYLTHNYGLARTLYEYASYEFGPESIKWVKENGYLNESKVAVTNGGVLNSKIIHSYGPNPAGKTNEMYEFLLKKTYETIFRQICLLKPNVVSLPPILSRNINYNNKDHIIIPAKILCKTLSLFLNYLNYCGIKEINLIDWGHHPEILGYVVSVFQQEFY